MDIVLVAITLGSFVAAFINAAFATGGVYIILATSITVFPVTVAVPLQPAFSLASLVGRCAYFWHHIHWPIVIAASSGALIGVFLGARIFIDLPEYLITLSLGVLLLVFIWFPQTKWKIPLKHPFFLIGGLHSFIATMFGVGGLLQPAVLRTSLLKLQITSTLAACLLTMDLLKLTGFFAVGFSYWSYWPHILASNLAGVAGTWVGKHVTHHVSEKTFRVVFKLMITLLAFRLIYRGVQTL